MPTVASLKQELIGLAAERAIADPLSGCRPTSERALTGILCFHGQRESIDWPRVPLYDVSSRLERARGSEFISPEGCFLSEHVLLHENVHDESIWGGMPADLLYLSRDLQTVVMFENKIGSEIGYEPRPDRNPLARQLDYLVKLRGGRIVQAILVVISGRKMIEADWYRDGFAGALQFAERHTRVTGYFAFWEDIFQAIREPNVSVQSISCATGALCG